MTWVMLGFDRETEHLAVTVPLPTMTLEVAMQVMSEDDASSALTHSWAVTPAMKAELQRFGDPSAIDAAYVKYDCFFEHMPQDSTSSK